MYLGNLHWLSLDFDVNWKDNFKVPKNILLPQNEDCSIETIFDPIFCTCIQNISLSFVCARIIYWMQLPRKLSLRIHLVYTLLIKDQICSHVATFIYLM